MERADSQVIDRAALAVLVVLQVAMLGALYTRTVPHPPVTIAPFALGPFISASIAMAVAALVLGGTATRGGTVVSLLAVVLALVSFGPHKWLDASIGQIWPVVGLAQVAAVVILIQAVLLRRRT